MRTHALAVTLALASTFTVACRSNEPAGSVRASGTVEATEVQVAGLVGGRLLELKVAEGDRVEAGQVVAQLDVADARLALQRAQAERAQADAQLRLLLAGARPEEIRQAEAQLRAAEAEAAAAREDLRGATADLQRFDTLLANNSGSRKQRDDAATRVDVMGARVRAAEQRSQAAAETLARLKKGARAQEIDAARARLGVVDAQIATLEKSIADATIAAPVAGIVTQKLADVGEILAPRAPVVSIVDLDHAWANIYIDEPLVPRVRLGQQATLYTDAGGPGIEGKVTFVSPRAEFTPRNVQTAEERSKLVYRIKVSVDNREGILKQGMPVEAEVPLS
ncbi:MAG TPA: efflux RND transporter periplasmic adaptor subunit [Vicinamibacterales bacterium]|nr:efflux RND transporter periplasmic adaptor subunit [Acidobacteriota bacterium]HOC17544.1 efflux RND transporter periplasmic adaptor subunit [Vicinamibacterales bacterium]